MQFFNWGRKSEGSAERGNPPPAEPTNERAPLDTASVSLMASYQLEGCRSALLTPSGVSLGVDAASANKGALVRRVEAIPGTGPRPSWSILAPRSEIQVSVFTDAPQLLKPGKSIEVPGLTDITVGDLRCTLPSFGIHVSSRTIPSGSDTSSLATLEKRSPNLGKAFESFREAIELLRHPAVARAGGSETPIQRYERARFRVNEAMRSAFRIAIDGNNESTNPTPSYREAILSLDVMRRSLVIDDESVRLQVPNFGDPSGRERVLDKLITDIEREVSTFYTVLFAFQLRSTVGTAVSTYTRHHREGGRIKPETDAVLLLHELGVPLSPYFLHQSSARRVALDIISANARGTSSTSQGEPPRS